jgi:hypothetical protein
MREMLVDLEPEHLRHRQHLGGAGDRDVLVADRLGATPQQERTARASVTTVSGSYGALSSRID